MSRFFLSLVFFSITTLALAQPLSVYRADTVPVQSGNRQLLYPWAGGHNNCQFSDMDFDGDGIPDLFVFDRTGTRVTTFKNLGTPATVDYVYAPQFQSLFPMFYDWVLLRDYNNDGLMDIFAGRWGGITVFKNTGSTSQPVFQLISDSLKTTYSPQNNPYTQMIFVNQIDIPAIRDVDGDGDLDIVSFQISGLQIDFHRNKSMELYGTPDSLVFENTSRCWGYLYENAGNPTLSTNANCGDPLQRTNPQQQNNPMHSGSCLECYDVDADGDLEVLIGDISSDGMQLARNGGTPYAAMFDSIDATYPAYSTPINLTVFPCGFHIDVDNDGAKDLLASPSSPFTSENFKSIAYYHNDGTTDSTYLQFVQNNFIQNNEIDVGDGAFPVFFDYDDDGLKDIVLGDYGTYANSVFDGKLMLLRNTGTATNPAFRIQNADFAGLVANATGILNPSPTFGDLDNDGDEDMIVGSYDGKLHYFEKQTGNAENFVLTAPNYQNIDVGNYAAPQLVDVDRDGLLDLLVGEQSGNVNYYRNTGTISAPAFTLVNPVLGGVDVRQQNFITGYSMPFLFDDHGTYKLLVGSEAGWIHLYDSIDGNLGGNFNQVDTSIYDLREGLRTAPALADINNDSVPDLLIGNYSGGMSLFMGDNSSGIFTQPKQEITFSLFPNPADNELTVVVPELLNDDAVLTLHDVSGREVLRAAVHSGRNSIGVAAYPSGIYFCSVFAGERAGHRKLIIR